MLILMRLVGVSVYFQIVFSASPLTPAAEKVYYPHSQAQIDLHHDHQLLASPSATDVVCEAVGDVVTYCTIVVVSRGSL